MNNILIGSFMSMADNVRNTIAFGNNCPGITVTESNRFQLWNDGQLVYDRAITDLEAEDVYDKFTGWLNILSR